MENFEKDFNELMELATQTRNPKLLKSIEPLANMYKRMSNKEKGYEPKCKVCNHEDKEEIERLHELGTSNRDIIRELNLEGAFSEQALGRHLKKHYPLSKKYYEKLRLIEEKEIKEAIESYPPIAEYLLDEDPAYTNIFLNEYGFCMDTHYFCEFIPKKEIGVSFETVDILVSDFKDLLHSHSYSKEDDIIKQMYNINKCHSCQLFNLRASYNIFFDYLIKKIFNKDVEFEKDINSILMLGGFHKPYVYKYLDDFFKKD